MTTDPDTAPTNRPQPPVCHSKAAVLKVSTNAGANPHGRRVCQVCVQRPVPRSTSPLVFSHLGQERPAHWLTQFCSSLREIHPLSFRVSGEGEVVVFLWVP